MKIGVDTFACDGEESETGTYLCNILKRIPPSGDLYELFGWEFERFAYGEDAQKWEFIAQCPINGETVNALWHHFKYPDFAKKRAYNACFFPAAHRRVPMSSPCPSIGVVHDISAYWESQKKREQLGTLIRLILPNALRRLDRIIAPSEWVKTGLIEMAGVKESKIDVVFHGIDTGVFYPRSRNEESVVLIQPFSFRRPYILYSTRLEHPTKNHARLIQAFDIFKNRTHYPHRLVLAGADSYGAKELKKIASESAYRNDIFFTGHFPTKYLPELYAGADIVVIPAQYEGFAMGILEAFASGVPVACARSGAIPEIAGDAAIYFNPVNPADMADRIVSLATNRDVYRDCRNAGLQRTALFSWDQCAERTLKIIQETIGK
ncbi:mannosyltransferase [Spirochaetia bacterium]|nr:mannosyltransferase [Spirochaetia bacterium]